MTTKELWYRWGWLISVFIILAIVVITHQKFHIEKLTELIDAQEKLIEIQNKHTCITYKQFTEWQAKYDMYVDSIVIYSLKGKKQKAIGLSDSISKYQILLNGM